MTVSEHVDFAKPPVVEVVCGVTFAPLAGFTVAHLGRFWGSLGDDFREVAEHPPLAPVPGGNRQQTPQEALQALTPRVWFTNRNQDHLVQLQRDRLLCNWRKLEPSHEYPRYDWVREKFEKYLNLFETFTRSTLDTEPQYTQFELTYVNHLCEGDGWSTLAELGVALPDCSWRDQPNRFLPTPDGISWVTQFSLPDRMGSLHVSAQSGKRDIDSRSILAVELHARGLSTERSKWFATAHEWIVKGFADLTGDKLQHEIWERKQ